MADVVPGMLVVEPDARGVATLGGGVTAALYESGLRISHEDDILAETVVRGARVRGGRGGRGGGRRAHRARRPPVRPRPHHSAWPSCPAGPPTPARCSTTQSSRCPSSCGSSWPARRAHRREHPAASAVVVHLDYAPATTGLPGPAVPRAPPAGALAPRRHRAHRPGVHERPRHRCRGRPRAGPQRVGPALRRAHGRARLVGLGGAQRLRAPGSPTPVRTRGRGRLGDHAHLRVRAG